MKLKDLPAKIAEFWHKPANSDATTEFDRDGDHKAGDDFDMGDIEDVSDVEDIFDESMSRWTGASVQDINALGNYEDSPWDTLACEHLSRTVPPEYQGWVKEARREHPDATMALTNSLASTTSAVQIVAIDNAGEALVCSYVSFDYEGSEGYAFKIMPKEEAFTIIDNYRASHDIVKEFASEHGFGLLPNRFDYSDIAGSFARSYKPVVSMEAHDIIELYLEDEIGDLYPLAGQTYIGPIEAISSGVVLQRVKDGGYVAHDAKCLVGLDLPAQRGNSPVQIRYTSGDVGIVQDANLGHELDRGIELAKDGYGL